MIKKSPKILPITFVFILGLAGLFLLSGQPLITQAETVISDEFGSNSNPATTNQPGENNFTTLPSTPNEGNFTTLSESSGDNGGGGGGGGGGGHRHRSSPVITLASSGLSTNSCSFPYLTKYIKFGQANDRNEVIKLQRFLRDFESFTNLAITGIYDEPTLTAVMVFQRRYAQDILVGPWGLDKNQPTGYVFVSTTLAINNLYCQRGTANNLDLRHVYDNYGQDNQPAVPVRIFVQEKPLEITVTPVSTTTPSSSTMLAAVIAGTNFIKDNFCFWSNCLFAALAFLFSYLFWRERNYRRQFFDYEEEAEIGPDT